MDTTDIATRARQLLDQRVDSATALGAAVARVANAQAALGEAQAAERNAWASAIAGGWSPGELKQLGFTPPSIGKRGPARRKGTRAQGAGKPAPAELASAV